MKTTIAKNGDGEPLLVFHSETTSEAFLLGRVRQILGDSCSMVDNSDGTYNLNVQPDNLLRILVKNY